jgi:hypothetical protein
VSLLLRFKDRNLIIFAESWSSFELHGRKYKLPQRPTVVICVDGFEPEYLERGIADGILPNMAKMVQSGFALTAKCAMPGKNLGRSVRSETSG